MNFYKILLVGLGGFAGSIARYVTAYSMRQIGWAFPLGTFTVNIVGSFILGMVIGSTMQRGGESENVRLLLITGFCGGFTTFSAFAFENVNLIVEKMTMISLSYIIASVCLGIAAVSIGMWIGKGFS